jgi:hypothetical protein
MALRELLEELEDDPPGCDMVDMDKLLRECGYKCYDDGVTLLYVHDKWGSMLTFPRSKRTVPSSRFRDILEYAKERLRQEGRI